MVASLLVECLTIFVKESPCLATPMPGIAWELKSPIKELIPIELTVLNLHPRLNWKSGQQGCRAKAR
jgi:hypothetical protein